MPVAQVNGCGIYYETTGAGPDVIFVHGEDHGIELFDDQVSYFAAKYRCTVYYRRGHGKSESAPYGYSLWNQTLDLAGLVDHIQVRQAAVVGVGMGNPVAISYALEYPDRLSGIAMIAWYELDGYPLLEARRKQAHQLSFAALHMKMHEVRTAGGELALRQFIEGNVDRYYPIFPAEPRLRARMVDMVASHPREHFRQAAEHYSSLPNLIPHMHRIAVPVLGICGEDDPSPDRPELLAHMPNFRQVWIKKARRFAHMEQPGQVNHVLDEFLSSVLTTADTNLGEPHEPS